jgi:NAD(P)H-hydrate repair Nnr-like enzyme with NAD(P)H-hydrate dehydratase domain
MPKRKVRLEKWSNGRVYVLAGGKIISTSFLSAQAALEYCHSMGYDVTNAAAAETWDREGA